MDNIVSKIKKYGLYVLVALGLIVLGLWIGSSGSYQANTDFGSRNYVGGSSASNYALDGSIAVPEYASAPSAAMPSQSSKSETSSAGEVVDRKVIRNGSLSLLVKKTEEAANQIKSFAKDLGGFVENANIYEVSDTSKEGTVTIRVPADKFDATINRIKELAIRVESEEINAQDVTEMFVDLEAQLKNLKAAEAQYLVVLKQAYKVEDILKVHERLTVVRDSIERLEGRLKYLSSQVDMSSITVSLTEEADVQVFGIIWRPLTSLKQAFRDMLEGLTGYVDSIIGFIFSLPVLILWLVTIIAGLWVVLKVFRFVKAKFFSSQ